MPRSLTLRAGSGPETLMHPASLAPEVWTADLDLMVAASKYLPTRNRQERVLRIGPRDRVQFVLAQREHDPANVPPEDRPRTHRARLGARVQRAALQELGVEAPARHAHHIGFRMARAVTPGHHRVLAFDHDVDVGVDQERAEGMVTVVARSLGDLEGARQVPIGGRQPGFQTLATAGRAGA